MKKITLLFTFLIAGFSYGQTTSGFVLNPSFEDGPAGNIPKYQTLNNWKLGGDHSGDTGVSADIQTTNVHAGDGSKALEVSSVNVGGEWHIKVMSTAYLFAGDGTNPIEVTVGFWAKTTDVAPGSANASGDMRLIVRDIESGQNRSERVLLTTDSWVYMTKTFTFDAAANYELTLFLEFGKVDGVTQIDGITTSVTVVDTTAPVITVTAGTDTVAQGSTWADAGATSDGGETVTVSGTVDASTIGTYTITYTATDAAGNTGTATRTVTVEATLGIDDAELSQFTYFPNPVNNVLIIKAQASIENITVYNMLGQAVVRSTPNTNDSTVDLSALQTGAYFVQVSINNTLKTVRVIKN
jgi:hypothetical protein